MLQLAWQSKAGQAAIVMLTGFIFMVIWVSKPTKLSSTHGWVGTALLLVSFSTVGHSTQAGLLTQMLVMVHLIGVAYWLGALLPLRQLCRTSKSVKALVAVCYQFSAYAVGYIAALIIAGTSFAYLLLGNINLLLTSVYGNVLLIKLSAVTFLLKLAVLNKFRLVPLLVKDMILGVKQLQISIQMAGQI